MSRHVQIRVVCLLVIVLEFTAEAQPKPTCRNDQGTLSPCSPEDAETREDVTKQGGPMSDCKQYHRTTLSGTLLVHLLLDLYYNSFGLTEYRAL